MQDPLTNTSIFIICFERAGGVYFLTHAHTDHMRGLHHGWRYGKLYCSKVSADILLNRGVVRASLLHARDLEQPFEVVDPKNPRVAVTATFADANHCPGSAMVVLEWPSGSAVVNTGDFRYYDALWDSPTLRRIVDGQSCARLHYDASWAHGAFSQLPSKCDSIGVLLDLIERHASERVIMHSHGLGDEESFASIANHFPGQKLLFADERRLAELKLCDFVFCRYF